MPAKRGRTLENFTRDSAGNIHEAEEEEEVGEEQKQFAAPEELARRDIVKLKRRTSSPEKNVSALPKVSLVPVAEEDESRKRLLQVNADKWQCSVCLSHNSTDKTKCAACDTPRPQQDESQKETQSSSKSPVKVPQGFAFANPFSGSAPLSFSFGTSSAPSSSGSGFSFSFGSSGSTSGFSFASSSTSTSGISLGTTPASTSSFSLGSNATGFSFSSSASFTPLQASETKTETEASPFAERFKDAKPSESGEEHDTVVGSMECGLIELVVEKSEKDEEIRKKFASRGKGEVHFNTYQDSDKLAGRIIIRMEKTQHVMLNARVLKQSKYEVRDGKYVSVPVVRSSGSVSLYLLKFKSADDAKCALDYLTQIQSQLP